VVTPGTVVPYSFEDGLVVVHPPPLACPPGRKGATAIGSEEDELGLRPLGGLYIGGLYIGAVWPNDVAPIEVVCACARFAGTDTSKPAQRSSAGRRSMNVPIDGAALFAQGRL